LKRLLPGGKVPTRQRDEDIAEFPVKWVLDRSLTGNTLEVKQDNGAHFVIIGDITIKFADYLREYSTRTAAESMSDQDQ
jgi:hypothetical protein